MRIPIICCAAMVLGLGCSGPEIHYDYDAKAGYAALHSYDWEAVPPPPPGASNPFVDSRLHAAVEAELSARHFQRATTADPDFLVACYPIYQRVGSASGRVGFGIGFGGFRAPGIGLGVSEPVAGGPGRRVGTIVLEILESRTHQVIWKAEAEDVLDDSATPETSRQDIGVAVKKMLARFPPTAPAD